MSLEITTNADYTAGYRYDSGGRLYRVWVNPTLNETTKEPPPDSPDFEYAYETPSHNLINTITGLHHRVIHTWEDFRDILRTKTNTKINHDLFSSITYGVNEIGQRRTAARAGQATNGTTWRYDSLGQVILADDTNTNAARAYEYDGIGNRKKSMDSTTLPGADNYTSNALNQYTDTPNGAEIGYDFDGNATTNYPVMPSTTMQTASFAWDAENRLIQSTVNSTTTHYQYDGLGRRIVKSTGSNVTLYLYDGWNCITEYSDTSTRRASYFWGTDLSGSAQGAGGVGGLLAVNLTGASAGTYYPLYDGNGNITEYVNSSASVAAHFEYDPFGRIFSSSGATSDFTYRFSTKPQDSETGLYYYGYRYYDPVAGRWPSRDPIGEEGGINVYQFVGNRTVSAVDRLGLHDFQLSGSMQYGAFGGLVIETTDWKIEGDIVCNMDGSGGVAQIDSKSFDYKRIVFPTSSFLGVQAYGQSVGITDSVSPELIHQPSDEVGMCSTSKGGNPKASKYTIKVTWIRTYGIQLGFGHYQAPGPLSRTKKLAEQTKTFYVQCCCGLKFFRENKAEPWKLIQ